MGGPLHLFTTTVGKKVAMALSGVVWVGYVVGHLIGNLQIFAGPEKINAYAEYLHHAPALLWGTRIVLATAILVHVIASTDLALRNLAARPIGYARKRYLATSYAARTMIWSGPILLLFIVYHLAHLTFGLTPEFGYDPHDVYSNVVRSFQIRWLVVLYVVAQLALCAHLYHGAWSFLQTLGANHPQYDALRQRIAAAAAAAIFVGYVSIPISVMAGVLRPAPTHAARSHDAAG
jgi:succinate dehydrogenase / fumarate reductase cytochrome b subunit